MFFHTNPYENAPVTVSPTTHKKLPLALGRHTVCVKDYINWCMSGKILGNPNNRGRGLVSEKTFKEVRADFNPKLFDSIRGCLTRDGQKLTLPDKHSSTQGILYRYWDDGMTLAELNHEFCLKVEPESFLHELYTGTNRSDPHKTKHRVDNPDQVYGHLLHEKLAPLLSAQTIEFFCMNRSQSKMKLLGILSHILFALSDHGVQSGWRATTVADLRAASEKIQDDPAGSLKIPSDKLDRMAKAMNSYYELFQEVQQNSGLVNAKPLMKLAQFVFFVVVEKMATSSPIPKKNKTLAINILKNYARLDSLARIMKSGSRENQEDHYHNMVRLLNGKSK